MDPCSAGNNTEARRRRGGWMSSNSVVPDSCEQSPDNEADGRVGGDREQSSREPTTNLLYFYFF